METVSIISLKGGTAKTTTAVNMAYILAAEYGKKVLVIDNDKQGNISKAFRCYDPESEDTTARIMVERGIDIYEVIINAAPNIDIIPANMTLLEANLKVLMDTGRQQQTRFKKAMASIGEDYDYCIIDNAPDINMSIVNALTVSDSLIIPVCIDQYSFDGLDVLMGQIRDVQAEFNEKLDFTGCLVTQYKNNEVNNQGIVELKKRAPVFGQTIRRTEKKVNESTFAGRPLSEYSPRCGASIDYRKFVQEFLEKTGEK